MNLFIIGNGKSRLDFDVNQLQQFGRVICCNSAFQDIAADAVSVNVKYYNKAAGLLDRIIVRNPDSDRDIYWNNAEKIAQMPNHLISDNLSPRDWNSGQVAIIAGIVKYKPTKVFLVGFDFFDVPDLSRHWQDQESNNVYHEMHNERPQNHETIYNWIVEQNPDVEFCRVGSKDDPFLDKLNMKLQTYDEFESSICIG